MTNRSFHGGVGLAAEAGALSEPLRAQFVAGAVAERRGKASDANPNRRGSPKARAWAAGWLAAREGRAEP